MAVLAIPVGWEILSGVDATSAAILFAKTAQEIISEKKEGKYQSRIFWWIARRDTCGEIEKAAKNGDARARKAKKLLNDKRFDK